MAAILNGNIDTNNPHSRLTNKNIFIYHSDMINEGLITIIMWKRQISAMISLNVKKKKKKHKIGSHFEEQKGRQS